MEGGTVDGPIGRVAEVGPRATVVPCPVQSFRPRHHDVARHAGDHGGGGAERDRKSTRLNSSHSSISYAVFCLKKKTTSLSATYTCARPPLDLQIPALLPT